MNGLGLTLVNNEGHVFDLFLDHGSPTIRVKDKFGTNLGTAAFIYLNDTTSAEMSQIETLEACDREALINFFLQKRFEKLSNEASKTYKVQCSFHAGKPFVIFNDKYGVQGGVSKKALSFAAGITKFATGILIGTTAASATVATLPVVLACTSAGLLATGVGSMYYAIQTPEDKITPQNFLAQSTINFVGGAAGGGAHLAIGGLVSSTFGAALSAAASSATSTTTATLAEATITNNSKVLKRLTPKKLALSAFTGILTSGVSSLARGTVEGAGQLLESPTNKALGITTKTAIGSLGGAASSSAVKLTDNLIKRFNFLKVCYEAIPIPQDMEQGNLYLYLENDTICFLSINAHSKLILTKINKQEDFLISHLQSSGTQFKKIKKILKSKGKKTLGAKQRQFIVESAAMYQHIPDSLMNGICEAAVVGASTGAVTALTSAVTEQWKKQTSSEKSQKQKTENNSAKRKRDETKQQRVLKRKIESRSSILLSKGKKPAIKTLEDLKNEVRKRKILEQLKSQPPEKKAKLSEESTQDKDQDTCVLKQVPPQEILDAEKNESTASQRLINYLTLFNYTPEELWALAVSLHDNTKNAHQYGSNAIFQIEKEISERFGIPMGTLTSTLQEAFKSNPDEHVPKRIFGAFAEELKNGTNLKNIQQELDQAKVHLESLKEPSCVIPEYSEPQPHRPTIDYSQLAIDIQNAATNSGNPGNLNVEMRILSTVFAGADNGNLFNQIYSACYEASVNWNNYSGKDKPTQYGFLVSLIDVITNGKPTVPVEVEHQRWYEKPLEFLGGLGIGFQTDGSNSSIGTMNQPNLVNVNSQKTPEIVWNYTPPSQNIPEQTSNLSESVNGVQDLKPQFLDSISPSQPSTVPFPAMISTSTDIPSIPYENEISVSTFQSSAPSLTHLQVTPTISNDNNFPAPGSLNAPVPTSSKIFNETISNTANITAELIKKVDNIPNMEGVGSYVGSSINKIFNTLMALQRINNPDYRDEPAGQQIACGLWGTVIELTGGSVAGALGGLAGSIGACTASQNAGDHAQQNCHDVLDMFKNKD